jgi:hypothetical protein
MGVNASSALPATPGHGKGGAGERAAAANAPGMRWHRRRKLDKYKYEAAVAPACGVAARAEAMTGLCGAAG